MLLLCLAGAGAAVAGWFYINQGLPSIKSVTDYNPPAVTRVFAADGQLMTRYFKQRRFVVPLAAIDRKVVLAFVAAEDGDFFHHQGIDLSGIIRAAWANLKAGRVVQGASTITQQVAQALLNTPAKAWVPKLKEMVFAWRMEQSLTKDEILYLYLNEIYLGHGAYGAEAAARTYFGKSASELSVAEGALLAGLVQAPSRYSPLRHPRRARTRQVYVIDRMLADGIIDAEQARQAKNQTLNISLHRPTTVAAPYYEETVRRWLQERFGSKLLYEGGLAVYTACDPLLTQDGRRAIAMGLKQLTRRQGYRGPVKRLSAAETEKIAAQPVGKGDLQPGTVQEMVVTALEQGKQRAWLRLGRARGVITLDSVRWAKPPAKELKEYRPPLKDISQVFQLGDVVRALPLEYDPGSQTWQLELVQPPVAQAALLAVENHSGRVRVIIGGSDFTKSQFNRAIQAVRQPGSAFKPIIFAAALGHPSQVFTASSVILDSPVVYDDPTQPGEKWRPKNYNSKFYGPTTLRQALAHSRNVVTVKLLNQVGLGYVVSYARRLGITSQLTPNLTMALGTSGVSLMELTLAYGVFADGGRLMKPITVEKVLDRHGQVLFEAQPASSQVIPPQNAYLITHLLKGVVEEGTGRRMRSLKRPLAGKTGTTNDLRDAWFMGYSPQLVCGVWVGQDDNVPLGRKETGSRAAGPIWQAFMEPALKDLPAEDFPVPQGVVFARVNRQTGEPIPSGTAGGFFESFLEGRQPTETGKGAQAVKKDAADFMRAESFAQPQAAPEDAGGQAQPDQQAGTNQDQP